MNILQREKENDRRLLHKDKLVPYKTELRLEVIARRRELTRQHFLRKERTEEKRVSKTTQGNVVTIDTNKARSNTDVVRLAVRDLGWREFPFQRRDHNCDITWHAVSFYDQTEIYSGQVNKFPGSVEIFRKVNTFRWLELMKSLFPDQYDFFPRTWLLPHQYNEFANVVRLANEKKPKHKTMYIVKPSEGSQGQGIYLLDDPSSYSHCNNRSHVVQEYLSNVFLMDSYKFDLRVYVVLKSLEPLEFYICREGLARFSTLPYEKPSNKNMHETFMHLTNYSLNKKSIDFKISDKDDEGSKRKMTAVFNTLQRMGHDVRLIWTKIEHLVTKTLIAVVGELKVEHQAAIPPGKPGPTCFQVLGFDIILLKNLQPMLLEVNANPSLSITEEHESEDGCVNYVISSKDEDVKRTLIRDTLTLVAPKHKFTRRRRRYRHRRPNNNGEEDMDTNSQEHPKHRRNYRREQAILVKHVDDNQNVDKSMFGQSGISNIKTSVGNEVIEGEGDTTSDEDRKSVSTGSEDSSQEEVSRMRSLKSWIRKKMGRNSDGVLKEDNVHLLPELVTKSDNSSDEDVVMQEEGVKEEKKEEVKEKKKEEVAEEKEQEEDEKKDQQEKEEKYEEEEDNGERGSRVLVLENVQLESSDDENNDEDNGQVEEEQSCLKQIFPAVYGNSFKNERIVENLADIFIMCLGVRGCLRLSPSMFRLFARKCHLGRKGITNADIDILYIDMQRKWEFMNPDRTSGLNFFAFVSGFCKIASDVFSGNSLKAQVQSFIEHCQNFLKIPTELDLEAAKRVSRYGQGFSRSMGKDFLRLPLADERRRPRSLDLRPVLLEKSLNDINFPVLHQRHRHVFYMLQNIKK
ncbi:hypothetical protein BsWGS_23703 [Bradybaena similaris]